MLSSIEGVKMHVVDLSFRYCSIARYKDYRDSRTTTFDSGWVCSPGWVCYADEARAAPPPPVAG